MFGRFMSMLAMTAAATAAAMAHSVDHHRQVELARLQAVADIKVQQLSARMHRPGVDARLVQAGADAQALFGRWRTAADLRSRDTLPARLQQMVALTAFRAISLVDEQGVLLWHSQGTL